MQRIVYRNGRGGWELYLERGSNGRVRKVYLATRPGTYLDITGLVSEYDLATMAVEAAAQAEADRQHEAAMKATVDQRTPEERRRDEIMYGGRPEDYANGRKKVGD